MGISEELNRCGFKLQLNFISEEDEKNLVLPLDLEEDVSGIIILSVFSQNYIEKILKQNIPTVFLDAPGNVETIAHHSDIVLCEGINSVKAITSDLISRGMKKIGFIGDITYCRTINDRYQGYLKALEEAGIEADNSIMLRTTLKTGIMRPRKWKRPWMVFRIFLKPLSVPMMTLRWMSSGI